MRMTAHIASLLMLVSTSAFAAAPITTDSRIKTFVYNSNEVFSLTTEYGYQSNIEFGDNESIDTVSVGDRVGWQIIPANRRLFIRAMEENAHTNMTVVTNKRAYQFDLKATSASDVIASEQLVYVVRFYYPGESEGPAPITGAIASPPAPMMPVSYAPIMPVAPTAPMMSYAPPVSYAPPAPPVAYAPPRAPQPQASAYPAPSYAAPAYSYQTVQPAPAATAPMNFRYTYSGPSHLAPVQIYDDGRSTYFKFRGAPSGSFSVITAGGDEMNVPARSVSADTVAVDAIAPRFSLRQSGQQVVVYNESNGA